MTADLAESLTTYLNEANVKAAISAYLAPGAFTGANFDRLGESKDHDRYTETDFLAVSTLSVTVPPATRRWLLGEQGGAYVSRLLTNIPHHDDAIEDEEAHLRNGSAAWELWYLLRQGTGMGPTTTSKLMAVKRPHLVPIHDSVVSGALGLPVKDSWSTWHAYMSSDVWKKDVKPKIREAAVSAGGARLSGLRIIDIVVWHSKFHERKEQRDQDRAAKGLEPLESNVPNPELLKPKERWVISSGAKETTQ